MVVEFDAVWVDAGRVLKVFLTKAHTKVRWRNESEKANWSIISQNKPIDYCLLSDIKLHVNSLSGISAKVNFSKTLKKFYIEDDAIKQTENPPS